MISKQPTIDDIYNFDAYISTPGVREGLVQQAELGGEEFSVEDTDDGQAMFFNAPHGEQVSVGRPVLVAEVGSRGLPSQAFTGEYPDSMQAFEPTIRQRLADYLQSSFEGLGMDRYKARQNAQSLIGGPSSNAPLSLGLADFVPFLGTGLQLEEGVEMGKDAAAAAERGNYGEAALLGTGAALSVVPGVAPTVKALKSGVETLGPKAGEMAGDFLQKQGLMPGVLPDGQTMPANPQAAVSDLGFFSAVEQAALNVQRKSGTGQAFLNDIAKGENVKADEIKWIGLDDFLKGKKNVTRDEVQQFIAQNKVEVQEVTLGGTDNSFTDPNKAIAYIAEREGWTPAEVVDNWGYEDSRDYIALANDMAQQDPVNGALPAKFGQYTLPGGENYREILLTMPDNTDPQKARLAFEQRMQQKYGSFNTMKFTDAEKAESESTMQAILNNDGVVSKGQVFESSHWDQKNVLAHIRVNDRVDADGKKMLLIEEVQSDWHQAGRDKGYKNDAALEKQFADLTQQHREIVARRAEIVVDPDKADEYKALAEQEQQLINQMNKLHDTKQYGVPDAPMKDTWYQLALKRALKYAADNGYERVGLTTGSRQAERYDLSKKISSVRLVTDDKGGTLSDAIFNGVQIGNGQTINRMINSPADLEDMVGKEIADRLLKSTPTKGKGGNANAWVREISGIDLQVGGEGMKKYYDEVYPKFLEKYGKKWGAKVGETTIDADGPEQIRFVDITPEMRQSVSKGQPLFTAAPVGAGTAATMQDEENQ